MVDALGWRQKFGVIAPSTNTSVEPEYARMQPEGVTNHFSRVTIPDDPVTDNESFVQLVENIREATHAAIDSVMSCSPSHVIMGMSAETFWDGAGRADRLSKEFEDRAGVGVTIGSHACQAAIDAYRQETTIRKVAILTPYMPVGDEMVRRFFTDIGLDVIDIIGLKSPSPMLIAHETGDRLRAATLQLNTSEPDAIIQCGTNLAYAHIAPEAERWLGKPVIAINTATYWHALRKCGIPDQCSGFGRLMSHH
jgi:maleate isomerase